MKDRPGIMFYFTDAPCITELSDADAGKLVKGLLVYAETGSEPVFDGFLRIVWLILKAKADHDAERYERQCSQRKYAVYCREQDKAGLPRASFDEWSASADIERYPTTTTTSTTATTAATTSTAAATAPTPSDFEAAFDVPHFFGPNGTVCLSVNEWEWLAHQLGMSEFCYILSIVEDEAAALGLDPKTLDWKQFILRSFKKHFPNQKLLSGTAQRGT